MVDSDLPVVTERTSANDHLHWALPEDDTLRMLDDDNNKPQPSPDATSVDVDDELDDPESALLSAASPASADDMIDDAESDDGSDADSDAQSRLTITSTVQLDELLTHATNEIRDFARLPYHVLSNHTEEDLYTLADELWYEADYGGADEESVDYFEKEGNSAETFGAKIAQWTDHSLGAMIRAEDCLNAVNKELQRSVTFGYAHIPLATIDASQLQSSTPPAGHGGVNLEGPKLMTVQALCDTLQRNLSALSQLKRAFSKLLREMSQHPELKYITQASVRDDRDALLIRADLERYKPFKLQKFLSALPRAEEDVAQQDIKCFICGPHPPDTSDYSQSNEMILTPVRSDKRQPLDEQVGVASDHSAERHEGIDVAILHDNGGCIRKFHVECLKEWLQVSGQCPLTRRPLF